MILCWFAPGNLETEKHFRRVMGIQTFLDAESLISGNPGIATGSRQYTIDNFTGKPVGDRLTQLAA